MSDIITMRCRVCERQFGWSYVPNRIGPWTCGSDECRSRWRQDHPLPAYDPYRLIPPDLCKTCRALWIQWREHPAEPVSRSRFNLIPAEGVRSDWAASDQRASRRRQHLLDIKSQHELIHRLCRRYHGRWKAAPSRTADALDTQTAAPVPEAATP